MLAEGQLISKLSGSSIIFLSNNNVVIKQLNSKTSSDTNEEVGTVSAEVGDTNAEVGTTSAEVRDTNAEVGTTSAEVGNTTAESTEGVSVTPEADAENIQTDETTEGDVAVIGEDTGMVQSSGEVAVDPAMIEGTQADPAIQAGMAGGKGTLLSSWPFVGGISIAVILVSIAIGTLLARRKIKKGIEIYED